MSKDIIRDFAIERLPIAALKPESAIHAASGKRFSAIATQEARYGQ